MTDMDGSARIGLPASTLIFHNDLIVERIVSQMSVVDRLTLYSDIAREEGKWKAGSLKQMVKWKEAIETAELVISDSMKYSTRANFSQPVVRETNVIPKEWLEKEDLLELKQLLNLSDNVIGIHLTRWYDRIQFDRILDVILDCKPKVTAVTIMKVDHSGSCYGAVMSILRTNAGRMEYISVDRMKPEDVNDLIKCNPYLKAFHSGEMYVDFVNKYIDKEYKLPRTTTLAKFWSNLTSYNLVSGKLGSNGSLRGIGLEEVFEKANHPVYEEIVAHFVGLELLLCNNCRGLDISRVKVMKNMKYLRLCRIGYTDKLDKTDGIDEILSNLNKLVELYVVRIVVPAITVMKLHRICPQLRKLEIRLNDEDNFEWYKTDDAVKAVCLLPKLEYYRVHSGKGEYILNSAKEITKKPELYGAGGSSESVGQLLVAND